MAGDHGQVLDFGGQVVPGWRAEVDDVSAASSHFDHLVLGIVDVVGIVDRPAAVAWSGAWSRWWPPWPAPPVRESTPVPPSSVSLPLLPVMVSAPPRPS